MTPQPIRLLYFAALRENLGCDQEWLTLPDEVGTVEELRRFLAARGGVWAQALDAARPWRAAVDQAMAQPGTSVRTASEIAFFPPVTGG